MLNEPANANLIRWSEAGDSFYVLDHERFARELLGRWFKHQNFNTFVRQLNMYGFHKIPHLHQGALRSEPDTDYWHYEHPHFIRGQPELLGLIQRKKQAAATADETSLDLRGTTPSSAPNAFPNPTNLSAGQILDIHTIINGVAAIKRHQQNITGELAELKKSHNLLWQETIATRARYQKHQDTINKILRFLAGVFGPNAGMPVRDDGEVRSPSSPLPRNVNRLLIRGPEDDGKARGHSTGSSSKVQLTEVEDEEGSTAGIHRPSDGYFVETPMGSGPPSPPTEPDSSSSSQYPSLPHASTSSHTVERVPSPIPPGPANGQSAFGSDTPDHILQSSLGQLLSQPGQMQRLLAALAQQPMSLPDTNSSSSNSLAQFDPNFDFSHMFQDDGQQSGPLSYLPNPPSPPHALPYNPHLENTENSHAETDTTMDNVESSLNSLIQSLGVGEFDPSQLGADGMNGHAGAPQQAPPETLPGTFDQGRLGDPQPDFDFEALLNDLATTENPLGDSSLVDMPSTAFLDEVPSPSPTSPSTPTMIRPPETFAPINGTRKRKSDAIDLDMARQKGIAAQAMGKSKARRTG